jgi:hypothetical protein
MELVAVRGNTASLCPSCLETEGKIRQRQNYCQHHFHHLIHEEVDTKGGRSYCFNGSYSSILPEMLPSDILRGKMFFRTAVTSHLWFHAYIVLKD